MAVGSTGRASLESFIWQREGEAEAGNAKGALRSDWAEQERGAVVSCLKDTIS
jgi:hypothetical protein